MPEWLMEQFAKLSSVTTRGFESHSLRKTYKMDFEYNISNKTDHFEYAVYLTEEELKSINFENYSTTFG